MKNKQEASMMLESQCSISSADVTEIRQKDTST